MGVFDMFSLDGKTALVTGGAGLFGRQMVRALAEAGAQTFVASRNLESVEAVAASHRGAGHDVQALAYDQSDEKSILSLRDDILRRTDRFDVLVNNSVARPMKDGYESGVDTFDRSMRVNATGLFAITRAFGDVMAEQGSGSIINIGSIQGMVGPDPTIYRGTDMHGWAPDYFFHKGGMINFTRFVASYYGNRSVRCNCVSPGGYEAGQPETFLRQYSDRTFLGRLANDTDLEGVIVFLASGASAYITGANIPVDGGYTAK